MKPAEERFATIAEATGSRSPRAVLGPLLVACGLKLTVLRGREASRLVVRFRQVGMVLLRRELGWSWNEIGLYFDGRDHSTIIHAHRTVAAIRKSDPAFARFLDRLEDDVAKLPNRAATDIKRLAVLAAPARGVMAEFRDLRAEVVGLRDELVRIREALEKRNPLRSDPRPAQSPEGRPASLTLSTGGA